MASDSHAPRPPRLEVDREDLLREATALVERVELAAGDVGEPVVVGFRANGAASVYFGADPAYHFTSAGELRRAYAAGRLVKAEARQLASMTRQRPGGEVQLVRHDLTPDETDQFLRELTERLHQLRRQLDDGSARVVGEVPTGGNVVARVKTWLATLVLPPAIAVSPRVG